MPGAWESAPTPCTSGFKEAGKTPRLVGQEDLRAENARLKAELKRVEEERDILKKAAAYFAKASW